MHPLENWIVQHTHVECSPYHELLLSLHVLTNPDHHLPRLEWANATREAMDSEMRDQILFYGHVSNEWLFPMDCQHAFCADSRYPEDSIECWQLCDENQFLDALLGKTRGAMQYDPYAADRVAICQHPRWHRDRLYHLLQEYQQLFFAREWHTIEPWLVRAAAAYSKGLRQKPLEALRAVHPRFRVEEKGVRFLKAETYHRTYSEIESITIYPSTFVAPHLLIDIDTPRIEVNLQVDIPTRSTQEDVPQDLLRRLRALADANRLRIMQALLSHPFCTQQLAERLQLSQATVSKHLKLLEATGLIVSERSSHYVFYRTNVMALEGIRVELDQFFDQPKLKNGEGFIR